MKRIVLILVLMACVSQLKAQQTWHVKPNDKLSNGLQNYFKPDAFSPPNVILSQPKNDSLLNTLKQAGTNSQIVYSRMPVAMVSSTDRMPIAKVDLSGYNMPVKRITIVDPLAKVKQPAP